MKHQVDHRDADHRLAAFGQRLVVLAQPAILAEPCKCSLYDPTLGQHRESRFAALDDLESPSTQMPGPIAQLSRIAAIGPDQFQTWEQSPALAFFAEFGQHRSEEHTSELHS